MNASAATARKLTRHLSHTGVRHFLTGMAATLTAVSTIAGAAWFYFEPALAQYVDKSIKTQVAPIKRDLRDVEAQVNQNGRSLAKHGTKLDTIEELSREQRDLVRQFILELKVRQ